MKKIFTTLVLCTAIGFTLSSCDNDDDHPTTTEIMTEANLPEPAKNFINQFFSDYPVQTIKKIVNPNAIQTTIYEVEYTNRMEIDFDVAGNWLDVDSENNLPIPTGFILPSIMDYVKTNYPLAQVKGIEKKTMGFEVELTNKIDLIFDPNGQFIRLD